MRDGAFWIGGFDLDNDNSWVWDDGKNSPFVATNWLQGEPNGSKCVASKNREHDFAWNDVPCAETKRFICEYEL